MFKSIHTFYEMIAEYFSSLANTFSTSASDIAIFFFAIILLFIVKYAYPEKKK